MPLVTCRRTYPLRDRQRRPGAPPVLTACPLTLARLPQPPALAGPGCCRSLLRGLPARAAGVVRCATGGRPARRPPEPPRTGIRGRLEGTPRGDTGAVRGDASARRRQYEETREKGLSFPYTPAHECYNVPGASSGRSRS